MKIGVLTVGTDPVRVPVGKGDASSYGLRLLGRAAAAGKVFVGTDAGVTPATGNLLPCGDPAASNPYTVPFEHFGGGASIYLVASEGGQTVDFSAA